MTLLFQNSNFRGNFISCLEVLKLSIANGKRPDGKRSRSDGKWPDGKKPAGKNLAQMEKDQME